MARLSRRRRQKAVKITYHFKSWYKVKRGHFFYLGEECYYAWASNDIAFNYDSSHYIYNLGWWPRSDLLIFKCKKYSGCWVEDQRILPDLPPYIRMIVKQYFDSKITALSLNDYLYAMGF